MYSYIVFTPNKSNHVFLNISNFQSTFKFPKLPPVHSLYQVLFFQLP